MAVINSGVVQSGFTSISRAASAAMRGTTKLDPRKLNQTQLDEI